MTATDDARRAKRYAQRGAEKRQTLSAVYEPWVLRHVRWLAGKQGVSVSRVLSELVEEAINARKRTEQERRETAP